MQGNTAIFAPGFSINEDGPRRFYRVSLHDTSEQAACQLYAGAPGATSAEWTLVLSLGGDAIGEYPVAAAADQGAATARLVQNQEGVKIASFRAVGGFVTVTKVAEDHGVPTGLSGTATIEFVENPIMEFSCELSGTRTQQNPTRCRCLLADGSAHYCDEDQTSPSCCSVKRAPTLTRTFSFDASLCANMCIFDDPTLANECVMLREADSL